MSNICKLDWIKRSGLNYGIPVDRCKLADNIRKNEGLEKESIGVLANLIALSGQEQPVNGVWDGNTDTFTITAGQRRFLAITLLKNEGRGDGYIWCRLLSKEKQTPVEIAFSQLSDTGTVIPSLYDQGAAFVRLHKDDGVTVAEIARRIGRTEQHVRNVMKLIDVPEELRRSMAPSTAVSYTRADEETKKEVEYKAHRGEKVKGSDVKPKPKYDSHEEFNTVLNETGSTPYLPLDFDQVSAQIKIADRRKLSAKTEKQRRDMHFIIVGLRIAAGLEEPLK